MVKKQSLAPLSWRLVVWATEERRWAGWWGRWSSSCWCQARPSSEAGPHPPLPHPEEEFISYTKYNHMITSLFRREVACIFLCSCIRCCHHTSSPPAIPFMGGVTSTATLELLGMFLSALEEKTEERKGKCLSLSLQMSLISNKTGYKFSVHYIGSIDGICRTMHWQQHRHFNIISVSSL